MSGAAYAYRLPFGILIANLLPSPIFWFEYFTDYVWSSEIITLAFPALVALTGFAALLITRRTAGAQAASAATSR